MILPAGCSCPTGLIVRMFHRHGCQPTNTDAGQHILPDASKGDETPDVYYLAVSVMEDVGLGDAFCAW